MSHANTERLSQTVARRDFCVFAMKVYETSSVMASYRPLCTSDPVLTTRKALNLFCGKMRGASLSRKVSHISEIKIGQSYTHHWIPTCISAHIFESTSWNIYRGEKYSRVSFYDDSLLRLLSSRTEHSRLVVHRCRNSSDLSLLSALLALFQCACLYSFSILVQLF